jgi:hypothetical protein
MTIFSFFFLGIVTTGLDTAKAIFNPTPGKKFSFQTFSDLNILPFSFSVYTCCFTERN